MAFIRIGRLTGETHRHSHESPFWRFSLRFYGRPGVADACLALQDKAGADVNLLLFVLFLAERKRQLSTDEIARLDAAVSQWRESVVKPLRALRRGLKPGIDFIPGTVIETFRAQIKRLELESEQIEQHRLEEFAGNEPGSPADSRMDAAQSNLAAYCAGLSNVPQETVAAVLHSFEEFHPIEPHF
jgi:uncharacterized protein (TIGR02444 family)